LRDHARDVELSLRVATVEQQICEIEMSQGNRTRALAVIRHCAATLRALARENPQFVRVRSQWGACLWLQSNLEADLGQYAEAERSARACLEVNEASVRDVPSYTYYRKMLGESYGILGKALIKRGSAVEGLTALRKSVSILEPLDHLGGQYNAVCYLALASAVSGPAAGPAASDRQREDADHAVAILRRLIAHGYANLASLKNDPDLDSLRSRADFQGLLRDLEFPVQPFAR
jgi:serine/threonine-protein kinase